MLGIVLGLMVGFLFAGLISVDLLDAPDWVVTVVFLAVFLLCGFAGFYMEKQFSSKYVETYIATKQTIEASLYSESLTGLERVKLVEQAVNANAALASEKYTASKWYGFACDKRVLELEPINLG